MTGDLQVHQVEQRENNTWHTGSMIRLYNVLRDNH